MTEEQKRWPTLTCPECGSTACSCNATEWQGEEIYVSCAKCNHWDIRPMFSHMSEADFAAHVQRWVAFHLNS